MDDTLPAILEEDVAQKIVSHALMQELVEELMKDAPDSTKVEQLSKKLNIPYSLDPVIQINTVLQSIDRMNNGQKPDLNFEGL